jgi:hypothetical protein
LTEPIQAGNWRRITFLYTTGEYLARARQLTDLIVEAEERQLLWRALRERALRQQDYKIEEPQDLDPKILAALLGIVDQIPRS